MGKRLSEVSLAELRKMLTDTEHTAGPKAQSTHVLRRSVERREQMLEAAYAELARVAASVRHLQEGDKREQMVADKASPFDVIPSAVEVRRRLAENIREGGILRQMLRLAERIAKNRREPIAGRQEGQANDRNNL